MPESPLGKAQLKEKSRAGCKHPDVYEFSWKPARKSSEEKGKEIKIKELKILEEQSAGIKIYESVDGGSTESGHGKKHKTVWPAFAKVAISVGDSCRIYVCCCGV